MDVIPCPTCDGTGTTVYRGEVHQGYDDPDYADSCAICGGTGEVPRAFYLGTDEDATECDECGAMIPDSEPSMVSASHEESCSLHPGAVHPG